MINFYLVRNPLGPHSGSYALTSYVPKKYPPNTLPCWWFWGDTEDDFMEHPETRTIERIERKLGKPVEPGTCVNLVTGEVTNLDDAPALKP